MCVVLSIAADKGGVGKTALTYVSAQVINRHRVFGQPVLVIDADPQANLTESMLGVPGEELDMTWPDAVRQGVQLPILRTEVGVDLLPSDISLSILEEDTGRKMGDILSDMIAAVRPYYGMILIDCPPGASNGITFGALRASDYALLVVRPDGYWQSSLSKMTKMVEEAGKTVLGIIINFFRKNGIIYRKYEDCIRDTYKELVLHPSIRETARMTELTSLGLPIRDSQGLKMTDPDTDVFEMTSAFLRRLDELDVLDYDKINNHTYKED